MEEWREIEGYDGVYEVSNFGNVQSYKRGYQQRLSPFLTRGYPSVDLRRGGERKSVCVHILVAEAFIGERPFGCEINHLDGDKENNNVSNLCYCTPSENVQHAYNTGLHGTNVGESHYNSKFTNGDIVIIRQRLDGGETQQSIADDYGVSRSAIKHIKSGNTWSHLC